MSDSLNDKQQAFLTEYLVDRNGRRAAVAAGYSPRAASSAASRLLALPAIRAELERHQARAAERARVTVDSLLAECEAARRLADEAGSASAMVAATQLKARLLGLLNEQRDDAADRERQAREQQVELKSASRLLSDAAVSLGLPKAATPAQIVGAISERPIATPEAFALLRAQHVDKP